MTLYKLVGQDGNTYFLNLHRMEYVKIEETYGGFKLYVRFIDGDLEVLIREKTAHDLEEYLGAWQ